MYELFYVFLRYPVHILNNVVSVEVLHDSFNGDGPGYLSRYSDSLRAGRSEDRLLVGARFSASVQTGSRAHNGYRVIPGGKATGTWR